MRRGPRERWAFNNAAEFSPSNSVDGLLGTPRSGIGGTMAGDPTAGSGGAGGSADKQPAPGGGGQPAPGGGDARGGQPGAPGGGAEKAVAIEDVERLVWFSFLLNAELITQDDYDHVKRKLLWS